MRAFAVAIAIAALAAFPAAAELDSSNSVVSDGALADTLFFEGRGCGTSASLTVPLPADAFDVSVVEPRVGATAGATRVTAVTPEPGAVRFTVVADGPSTCEPAEEGDTAPSERAWAGNFDYVIRFSRRVQVRVWVENDKLTSRRTALRPRKLHFPFISTLVNIRWKSFGGKKAVGSGTLRVQAPPGRRCNPRMCPGHGQPFRVELTRPSTCGDLPRGTVYYGREVFITTRRAGVIGPGRLFQLNMPHCVAGAKPLR